MNEGIELNKLNFVATECSVSGPFLYVPPFQALLFVRISTEHEHFFENTWKLGNHKHFKSGIHQTKKNVNQMTFYNLQNIRKVAPVKISVSEDFNSGQWEAVLKLKHPIKSFLAR